MMNELINAIKIGFFLGFLIPSSTSSGNFFFYVGNLNPCPKLHMGICYEHQFISILISWKNTWKVVVTQGNFIMDIFSFFKHLYWGIIALHCCVSCCCITKWISYTYTYIPISLPSCVSLPPSLSHPSRWSQSTELISLCYAAASH